MHSSNISLFSLRRNSLLMTFVRKIQKELLINWHDFYFGPWPMSQAKKCTTFWRIDLPPSSGEDGNSMMGTLKKADLEHCTQDRD